MAWELYEAALLDRAGRVRQFFSITIPMLRPTIIFVVITATIGGLQIFDEPRVCAISSGGGPRRPVSDPAVRSRMQRQWSLVDRCVRLPDG